MIMSKNRFFNGKEVMASSCLQRMASAKSRIAPSNVVTVAVTCIPDTYRVVSGKISSKEYGIRMAERGAGIAGSSAGTYVGIAVGTCICPGVGTAIGGLIGGLLGGMGSSKVASKCLR